jgi:hypothetical protein
VRNGKAILLRHYNTKVGSSIQQPPQRRRQRCAASLAVEHRAEKSLSGHDASRITGYSPAIARLALAAGWRFVGTFRQIAVMFSSLL